MALLSSVILPSKRLPNAFHSIDSAESLRLAATGGSLFHVLVRFVQARREALLRVPDVNDHRDLPCPGVQGPAQSPSMSLGLAAA